MLPTRRHTVEYVPSFLLTCVNRTPQVVVSLGSLLHLLKPHFALKLYLELLSVPDRTVKTTLWVVQEKPEPLPLGIDVKTRDTYVTMLL